MCQHLDGHSDKCSGSFATVGDDRFIADEDGAEVIDIGQRRAGDDRVAERTEESVTVVVAETVARADPFGPGALQGIGRVVPG